MLELGYLTDKKGQLKAVVVPIEVWRELFLEDAISIEELSEAMEDYCLNRVMDEAKASPLMTREEALDYLGV